MVMAPRAPSSPSRQFSVYFKPELVEIIDEIAEQDHTSRASVIKRATEEYAERRRKERRPNR